MKVPMVLLVAPSLSLLVACGGGGGSGSVPPVGGPATHFSVSAPANIPSAISFKLTVTALDASNNPVTNYSGTVHFTSTDVNAQLPSNSTLVSGTRDFSALLTSAGSQMVSATDVASASIAGSSNSINVSALPDAFPVETFGAQGDGHTDDTAAIQATINAAAAAGGGSVLFKVARYYTAGTLQVPGGVVLCGNVEGPFDVSGIDPATTAVAPTLLVTNTSAPFITLTGLGSGVTDLLFHYPNQVKTGGSVPTAYPYTIQIPSAVAAKVARSTVTNAYNFLDIERGRIMAADLMIGAFNVGVNVDNAEDFVSLRNLHNGVFWDEVENASYPTAIDNWVLAHGTALVVGRMDGFEVHDFYVFSRFAGMLLTDSPDTSLNPRCGNGRGSDIDIEMVQYGIIATAAFPGIGYKFTNVQVAAAPGLGQAAVQLRSGGTSPPDILISGGSQRGSWALGAFPNPQAGNLYLANIQ